MRLNLLLSAVAAACLILPEAALADPPQDRSPEAGRKDQPRHQAKGEDRGKPDAGRRRDGANRQGSAAPPHAQQSPAARRAAPKAPDVRVQQSRRSAPPQAERRQAPRPAASPPLGDWRPIARGPDRDRAGQQWRQTHQSWDRNAPWRQAPDWWRRDSGFRLFAGPRIGFFFVPYTGYIVLPRQYRNHHWREGEYLPAWFRRFVVRDYGRYGLPRPPGGCIWIWLNGDVALVDRSDGYVLDIVHDVW